MKSLVSAVSVALMVCSASAMAQNPPITYSTQTYTNLVGGTAAPLVASSSTWTATDEGSAVIPLGFNFPWYGDTYNQIIINSNGVLILDKTATPGTSCVTNTNCLSNSATPSTTAPNGVIAAFWDDLNVTAPGQILYTSTPGDFEVEYRDAKAYGGGYTISMRVKLSSSGAVFVHYGPKTGSGGTGTMGFENGTGTVGANIVAPGQTACGVSCTLNNFVPNTYVVIGQPQQADLLVSRVDRTSVTASGSNVTVAFSATIQNIGLTAANGVLWKAYLSTNTTLEASDTLIYTSTAPLNFTPVSSQTVTGSGTATISPGQYYVLVEADSSNAVMEASESNNVGSTSSYFVNGLDLVAQTVSGPANSGPGNQMAVNVSWFNQGTDPAGSVKFRILLSLDAAFSANDFVLYEGTRTVAGGQSFTEAVTFNVPNNVPGGDFFYLLQIDPPTTGMPNGAVTEANENNNVAASAAKVNIRQADLVNNGGDFLDPVTGSPTRVGYFGQPGRATVNISNVGGADARNFEVQVAISRDLTFSALPGADYRIVPGHVVTNIAQGTSQQVTFDFTLPTEDSNTPPRPFTTGNYYLFFLVDANNDITELSEGNNILPMQQPVRLSAPAADLTVMRLDGPAGAGVGEVAPLFRSLKNVGNIAAPAVKYRYYASANAIISPDDTLLPIVQANGMQSEFGTVTLGVGQSDSNTDLVQLPASLSPGTYYFGVIIDGENAVPEIDETNNAVASSSQVQIAASSLKVVTTALPDAVVGRPYSFRLTAAGLQGTPTWTIAMMGNENLPAGLQIDASGLITGIPTAASVTPFTAIVSDGSRQAVGRLVLRVLPSTTQVEVTTSALPPIVNSPSVTYEYTLGASGGVKPYTWRITSGTLPGGAITLNPTTGVISGNPRSGTQETMSKIVVEVSDSLGSKASRELTARVVAPGSIVISASSLNDALVNVDYTTDISAKNSDMSALEKPISWRLVSGNLPDGLTLNVIQDVAVISGTPLVAGVFAFGLQVEDGKGRSDTAELQLRVYPGRLKVVANGLPEVARPGETPAVTFSAGDGVRATYSLYAGSLPAGLTLNADGTVSGSIEDSDAAVGSYNFVVEAVDASNASGLGAFGFTVEREVKKGGCSAAPGVSAAWLLLGLLPMAFKRRKGAFGAALAGLAAVAAMALPSQAFAQNEYQVVNAAGQTFAPLTSGVTVQGGQQVTIPFAFSFYGAQPQAQVTVSQYGYLAFAGSATDNSNDGIPNTVTSAPTTFIAPWWDQIGTSGGGKIWYQTLGAAPRRQFVVEWSSVANCTNSGAACTTSGGRFTFQAILFETTNQIRFAYGQSPTAGSASVGIQKSPGVGISAASCTTASSGTCSTFPLNANSVVDFFTPPDFVVGSMAVDQVGYAGVSYRAGALVKNTGGRSASTKARFYLSTDTTLTATGAGADPFIGETADTAIPAVDERLLTSSAPIPASTMPGNYFVLCNVDEGQAVVETNEANNQCPPTPITIGMPTPDLVVSGITATPATTMPGGTLTIARVLRNQGNADAPAFKYTYFLSDNAVASLNDRGLPPTKSSTGLPSGAMNTNMDSDMITLPTDIAAGKYWIGACVNYDTATPNTWPVNEISVVNNCATAAQPIVVSTGALAITTTTLEPATQYANWSTSLQATGGDGTYVWAVKAGSALPAWLSLSPIGQLSANPQQAGTFTFEVTVSSAGAEVSGQLSLTVTAGDLPLVIPDQTLQAAIFGSGYTGRLVATGGKPPYRWSLAPGSRLPGDIFLADDGYLEGRGTQVGDNTFTVVVTDSTNATAMRELGLRVVAPTTMHVATTRLATAYLRREYAQKLDAVGGKAPYTWTIKKFQQLPENPTEAPGMVTTDGKFPDNFGIALINGNDVYLRGVPTRAGLYAITFEVQDINGAVDTTQVLLTVSYETALAITTTALPDAFIGATYSARLAHNGGSEAMGIKYSLPCVMQATSVDNFSCAASDPTQVIPTGLTLAEDGSFSGSPDAAVEPNKVYSFLVKVTDEQGRQDVRSLSIRVRNDFAVETGGCGCSSGIEPFALLAGLFAMRGALKRRRSN